MKSLDVAVIGSGIGGSLISALNADKNLIMFEKDSNLGGCASTFKKYGNYYNAGATTFVGYENGQRLKNMFDFIGLAPNITKTDIAIRVVQNGKIIDRIKNFECFLENIEDVFPNQNNRLFWTKIKEIDEKFWKLKNVYYGKFGFRKYVKTSMFLAELIVTFKSSIFKSANCFIQECLGDIGKDYMDFIDSQLLITIQTTSKDISLLSMALGLSYPFHDVFYVNGGMSALIEDIVKKVEVRKNEEILKIKKDTNGWILKTTNSEYKTNKVILNSSIYQSANLFEDNEIIKYYNQFSFSDQSAFVTYISLKCDLDFLEHYQFIFDDILPNSISRSFFVSFSKKYDEKFSKNGYSITISTHTKANYWKNLSKNEYEDKKLETQNFISNKFLEYFSNVKKENISKIFSATSLTFNRYLNRYNCGGKAIGFKNMLDLPSSNTPFNGLYNIGDTVFAGQGWPGISIGVDVLHKEINGSS